MNSPTKKSSKNLMKTKPTIFPLGFAVGKVENSAIVVEFFDVLNGEHTIIESIAMPFEKAMQLSITLKEAIEHAEDED